MSEQRYFFNVVEEAVLNPDYRGYRGGRIEVYDNVKDKQVYEARFLMPEKFYEAFTDLFDFRSDDLMPMIVWNYEETPKYE